MQTGRLEASNFKMHRRYSSGRQPPQVRHRQIGDAGHVGVGIGPRLKIDFDQADAREGAGLNVVDAAGQREDRS